jgi:hypothetical protein
MISSEASFRAAMMNLKSSVVITVFILVTVALDFFQEEGLWGETFLLFVGSTSSVGDVTSSFFCSVSLLFISLTSSSPPQLGDTKDFFSEELLK